MKRCPLRVIASLIVAWSCAILFFPHPAISQDSPPLVPVPPIPQKTYSQLVRELQDVLTRPSAQEEGVSYSATTMPQGGLVISRLSNSSFSSTYSPLIRDNLLDAYSSPSTWTDDAGVVHVGWSVSVSVQEPLWLLLPDGTVGPTHTSQILFFSNPQDAQAAVDAIDAIRECATTDIDWKFLEGREGRKLDGYVPKRNGIPLGKSGVTIGIGIDLGQYSPNEINNWSIPSELKTRLLPYAYPLKGLEADMVANQLHITSEESDQLDVAIREKKTRRLIKQYDAATQGASFVELPQQAQTVIFSVTYQFGSIPAVSPRLWDDVIHQQWQAAAADLRDFNGTGKPSAYQNRRELEAKVLDQLNLEKTSP